MESTGSGEEYHVQGKFIPTVGSMMLGTVNRLNTERRRIAFR